MLYQPHPHLVHHRPALSTPVGWPPSRPSQDLSAFPHAKFAGVGRRLVAAVLDLALVGGLLLSGASLAGAGAAAESTTAPDAPAGLMATSVLATAAYFMIGYRWRGCTLGMAVLRLRVVNAETLRRPTLGQAIGRFLFWYVLTTLAAIGMVAALWDPCHRAWHDRASGTAVIRV